MKRIILSSIILAVSLLCCGAQNAKNDFFLDNNVYSYRFNPAIAGEKGFAGVAVNSIDLSLGSNLGINSFLVPKPDGSGLTTILNKSISPEMMQKGLQKTNSLNEELHMSLLAFGFWQKDKEIFHNMEINVREMANTSLARDIFTMLKVGSSTTPYDLSRTNFSANGLIEIAYGQTRKVGDKFSVGGRIKFLAGLANVNTNFTDATLLLSPSEVKYNVNGQLRAALPFIRFGVKQSAYDPDKKNIMDLSKMEFDYNEIHPAAYGGALDLGVTYRPVKDLTLGFSVIDLGGLVWNYNNVGISKGTDSYTGFPLDLEGEGIRRESEEMLKTLQTLIEFEKVEGRLSQFEMLPVTMNLSARYRMPFYNRLSVGMLGTFRINRYSPLYEGRIGATITPIDWFSLCGSYALSNYGNNWGAAISLNAACINFQLGLDAYSGPVSTLDWDSLDVQWLSFLKLPLGGFRYNLHAGITITFGQRHNDFEK